MSSLPNQSERYRSVSISPFSSEVIRAARGINQSSLQTGQTKHGGGVPDSVTSPVPSAPEDDVVLVLMFLSFWNPAASQTAAPS